MEYNSRSLEIIEEIVHELFNAIRSLKYLGEVYVSFLDAIEIRFVIVTISCALEITVKDIMRMF